jgi:hypothetical protein
MRASVSGIESSMIAASVMHVPCSECDRLLAEFNRLVCVDATIMRFLRENAYTKIGADSDALRMSAYQAQSNSQVVWRELRRHQRGSHAGDIPTA